MVSSETASKAINDNDHHDDNNHRIHHDRCHHHNNNNKDGTRQNAPPRWPMTQNRKDQPTRHPVTHTLIVLDDVFLGVSVGATSDVDGTPTGLRHRFG